MKHIRAEITAANGIFLVITTDSESHVLYCFKKNGESDYKVFMTADHCEDTIDSAHAYLRSINNFS